MNSSDDGSSDSEYNPEAEVADIPSEAETDYDSDGNKIDKEQIAKTKKRRKRQSTVKSKQQKVESPVEEVNEEEEKRRKDALWADFMNDTNSTPSSSKEKENFGKIEISESATKSDSTKSKAEIEKEPNNANSEKEKEKFITKVFDFAGEEIQVVEKVEEISKPQRSPVKAGLMKQVGTSSKFTPTSKSGIGSVLNSLGKKNKISVLEKSKLDWKSYKQGEGIDEELQTFNKGKDGYLERQDFLQRTDLRQFEIEKNLRQSKKSNR